VAGAINASSAQATSIIENGYSVALDFEHRFQIYCSCPINFPDFGEFETIFAAAIEDCIFSSSEISSAVFAI
jgi:hypothetical protein